MEVLILQAHPSENSFNQAILDTALVSLQQSGINPTLIRLGKEEMRADTALRKPSALMLIYPTWWGGYPASLMQCVNEIHQSQSDLLQDVRSILSITTHGSSKFINLLQGEWGRWYTKNRIAKICENSVQLKWTSLYKIDRCTNEELKNYLPKVKSDVTEFLAI
ncbi:MAG: hypothetical protein VXW76_04395 [Actinomycetota bacterium]|nr:hypothetical protein [Actinomycetota bacterium]